MGRKTNFLICLTYFLIKVSKADQRFFPFNFRGDESGDHHGMVSEVTVINGSKFITFRSIIQIKNHFSSTINVFAFDGVSNYTKLSSIAQDSIFHVPLAHVYRPPHEFFFQVKVFLNMDMLSPKSETCFYSGNPGFSAVFSLFYTISNRLSIENLFFFWGGGGGGHSGHFLGKWCKSIFGRKF